MINIVFVSDSSKHFQTAIDEYKKRLDIKLFQIKPTKHTNSQKVIEKDTENINKFLEKRKDDFNILLSLSGNSIDTIQFKDILKKKLDMGININFIIGGAFGLNEADVLNVDYKLHLSKMTFPHAMALLILLEQIYRSIQLINGRQYHY